jgi:sortase A
MAVVENENRRRTLRALSTILIVAGALMLVDAGLTMAWQEPFTALITKLRQDRLGGDLRALEKAGPTRLEQRVLATLAGDRRRIAFLARSLDRRTQSGQAVGRIDIPRVGANFVIVKGTSPADLRKGPGIYDNTPFPGAPGTTGIAGHRTTFLAPFRHIDRLRRGDPIHIHMPYGDFTYRVERHEIVDPGDLAVVRRVRYDRLVLSACHPLFSAAKRWIVYARLVNVVPTPLAIPSADAPRLTREPRRSR